MKFQKLDIEGAYLIELEEFRDNRGTFVRQFCKKEFANQGIDIDICQCNISNNIKKNTIRGMHYQKQPFLEPKIVSCLTGCLYDVIVDMRRDSRTYLKWLSVELKQNDNKILYIPPNVAHGFQTLEDNSTILYQLGEFFQPCCYTGFRYDDPKICINWKNLGKPVVCERDLNYAWL